ncbi:MAG: SapC family protein [Porticoccaceae bacterium]|nr:SapC family protein [Porticoccaceae bacterium]
MSNYVVLSPATHKNTHVLTERGEAQGDSIQYSLIYPLEFRNIQSCYPIFFSKSAETGEFFPIALFGFENNENLFLDENGWSAAYIPMMVERQPFLIGYQGASEDDLKPIVSIDMDSPKMSEDEGQALFDKDSQPTEFLKAMMTKLESLHHGHEHNKGFITALTAEDLLEPFTLEITLDNGSTNQLMGFYTINENKLQELDGSTLADFNSKGYLQPIYMAVASYARIRALIDKKNALTK